MKLSNYQIITAEDRWILYITVYIYIYYIYMGVSDIESNTRLDLRNLLVDAASCIQTLFLYVYFYVGVSRSMMGRSSSV